MAQWPRPSSERRIDEAARAAARARWAPSADSPWAALEVAQSDRISTEAPTWTANMRAIDAARAKWATTLTLAETSLVEAEDGEGLAWGDVMAPGRNRKNGALG